MGRQAARYYRDCAPGVAITTLLAAASVIGCGSKSAVPLRPEPVPYADTLPSLPPATIELREAEHVLKASVGGELGHAFSLRRWVGAQHEALNITRFDDVVSSAWFEHRNGRRRMTPEEVARAATTVGPDTSRNLTLIAGKWAGISPGFTVRDASGTTFLFKFDPKGNLRLASAAGVISSRLFHAAGYHTPEDFIVVFDSAKLELDPQAMLDTDAGKRLMTQDDIAAVLSLTDTLPDGRFLALASKIVPGRPLGPFLFSGVRKDDANDYYYHDYRRELRGLYVVASWLNHVDMRFANTLDVFIDPPGYVRHYLIDFAATLGSGTIRSHNPREGSEYNFDLWATIGRLLTLGFLEKGWEDRQFEEFHPAVGWLHVEEFQPGKWKANWPNPTFNKRTARDNYWGAKLVGAFTDDQIAAAVSAGQLPTRAADILTRILIRRRDKVVAHWYGKVAPIENPHAELVPTENDPTLAVSFDDLGLQAGVWDPGETRYLWRFEDAAARVFSRGSRAARAGARQTLRIDLPATPAPGDLGRERAFATLRISAVRPRASNREAVLYLRWVGPPAGYEVVGLEH